MKLFHRIALALTALTGLVVGGWAAILPQSFYDSFPGFGLMWIAIDGPFNEHLTRDVGALYLAIGAISVYAVLSRSIVATRSAGIAWAVFGVPHLYYHLHHVEGLAPIDAVGSVVGVGSSLLLGILLLVPARARPAAEPQQG